MCVAYGGRGTEASGLSVITDTKDRYRHMRDTRLFLHQAQHHVGTAQTVLEDVGRGLAVVERVEVAAERAVPVLRTVLVVALGCAVGVGIYLLVARVRRSRRTADPVTVDPPAPVSQL